MFEDKTFENILGSMLGSVLDTHPDLDINTGSIIYTALAPIALELETAYHEMDMILTETFLETASLEYLTKHGDQIGVALIEATCGHYEGEFNVDLEIGSRFNLDKFNYTVIEKLSDPTDNNPYYNFELVCETAGSTPNGYLGDLTPITYVGGLSHAKLISVIIYGEDEEDAESYRYRLQVHLKSPPVNGNVAQYNEWLDEYSGVGKYRVTPCWNGINTVKLTILSAENTAADEELIREVQNYFDPPTATINDNTNDPTYPQGRGMGNGQSYIGSIVTVDTVTQVPVVVNCKVALKDGYTSTLDVQKAVGEYLNKGALDETTVDYMALYSIIYNVDCVGDIISLTISAKGTTMDVNAASFVKSVTLAENEIAVLDAENSVWGV